MRSLLAEGTKIFSYADEIHSPIFTRTVSNKEFRKNEYDGTGGCLAAVNT
jgi:hypothetical protein